MADLESTLHYSLRVELASHTYIGNKTLVSLKMYISVLTKVETYSTCTKLVYQIILIVVSWIKEMFKKGEKMYSGFRDHGNMGYCAKELCCIISN